MSTKLKDILSEVKWGGNDIELGQVVTFKDYPAFKTPSQLKSINFTSFGCEFVSIKDLF